MIRFRLEVCIGRRWQRFKIYKPEEADAAFRTLRYARRRRQEYQWRIRLLPMDIVIDEVPPLDKP